MTVLRWSLRCLSSDFPPIIVLMFSPLPLALEFVETEGEEKFTVFSPAAVGGVEELVEGWGWPDSRLASRSAALMWKKRVTNFCSLS